MKEHIITHTHLNVVFKQVLHFSTLAIKLRGTKLFQAIIINATP